MPGSDLGDKTTSSHQSGNEELVMQCLDWRLLVQSEGERQDLDDSAQRDTARKFDGRNLVALEVAISF